MGKDVEYKNPEAWVWAGGVTDFVRAGVPMKRRIAMREDIVRHIANNMPDTPIDLSILKIVDDYWCFEIQAHKGPDAARKSFDRGMEKLRRGRRTRQAIAERLSSNGGPTNG